MNQKKLKKVCEYCLTSDKIVASWNKEDKEEKIDSISNYLCPVEVDEETYNDYLNCSNSKNIISIKNDLQDYFINLKGIVNNLKENRCIDDDDAKIIIENITSKQNDWLNFSKSYSPCKVLTR